MSWTGALTGQAFRKWVLEIASGSRIPQGEDLDPFTTSMRDLKQVSHYLETIQAEGNLNLSSNRTTEQRLIDLRSAELVSRHNLALTGLGRNVLRRWQAAEIANDKEQHELPRCLSLVQETDLLELEQYRHMLRFWTEIRNVFNVDELLKHPEALYTLSYLNQESAGYNPWKVIRSVTGEEVDKKTIDWDELEQQIPSPTSGLRSAIHNLARRVHDYSTRASGRVNYCRAMELHVLDLISAREILQNWSLPEPTEKSCLKVLATRPVRYRERTRSIERVRESRYNIQYRYNEISDDDPKWEEVKTLLDLGARNLLFVGPPGTSKTTYAMAIAAKLADYQSNRLKKIQFHQSFGYENFMEGYVPDGSLDTGFVLKDHLFLEACSEAYANPNEYYVFVIDELNRGDPSRVFGEALTYIEFRDEPFTLPSGNTRMVPNNLIIIATMNPHDKSIASLDQATDRRFEKVEFNPDPNLLREILAENDVEEAFVNNLTQFFVFLTREVEDRIGHAYFKGVRNLSNLRTVWKHRLLPMLEQELRYNEDKLREIKERFDEEFNDSSQADQEE